MKKLFWMGEEMRNDCGDVWCSRPHFDAADVMDEIHQQVIHKTDGEMSHIVGYIVNCYAVDGNDGATADQLFYDSDEWIDDDSIVEQIVYEKPDNPTCREYFDKHYNENMSWCRPFSDGNGNCIVMTEGYVNGVTINDVEVPTNESADAISKLAKTAADYERKHNLGYPDLRVALEGMKEIGCTDCPFNGICEALDYPIYENVDVWNVETWNRKAWKKD